MRSALVSARLLSCAMLLSLLPVVAFAQAKPIQQRMSTAEFKAAGLDKLSAAELENLNRWLSGTLQVEKAEATAAAEKSVKQRVQGFFDFDGRKEPVKSRLVGEFRGFAPGRVFTLENGQQWEVTESAELNARVMNPEVEMRPGVLNTWWMLVGKYNTRAKVRRVK